MLAHSPPLPLVIDFFNVFWGISAKDEEGIILALKQRDRVRRVRLAMSGLCMLNLIMAFDEEYPVLEYLIIKATLWTFNSTTVILPETFQAPRLHHLLLSGFALPMGSRLFATAMGLVTLALDVGRPSFAYFQPNTLLQWLSFMPQLEKLLIVFLAPVPDQDVEGQVMHTPIISHVILPNLRWIEFHGVTDDMEAVVCRITAPRLEELRIQFFEPLSFSVPCLLHFMETTENLRFDSVKFEFFASLVYVRAYLREEAEVYPLSITVSCGPLDFRVFVVAQTLDFLGQIFSTVEHLTLEHKESSEEDNEVEWRELLRSFPNVKTLWVDDGLVEEFSRSLLLDDGELPLELLPELQKLTYSGTGDTADAFTPFVDARQNAGRPVALVRPGLRSVTPLLYHRPKF